MAKKFYSGFVSLVGKPNVGKSTLMNCLIGEKIAIISNKPQTTRNKITSILTKDDYQVVFIDTPGIHKPKSKLGNYMVKSAETSLNEVDVVLMLVEPSEKVWEMDNYVIEKLKNVKTPVVLVINKVDTVEKEVLLKVIDTYRGLYNFTEIVPVSALKGENTETLLSVIKKYLPEGPQYFPSDMVTDQPERQIASEIIREKALRLLQDEIPQWPPGASGRRRAQRGISPGSPPSGPRTGRPAAPGGRSRLAPAPCCRGRRRYPYKRFPQRADTRGTGTPGPPGSGSGGYAPCSPRCPCPQRARGPRWASTGR